MKATTYLLLRNRPDLTRRSHSRRDRTDRDVDGTAGDILRRDEVSDLVRDDLDHGDARVVLVALVHTVSQVAEPRRDTGMLCVNI